MARIIIAEDDEDLRVSFADYLAVQGHDVVGVADAVGLYQKLGSGQFDIALLDVNLPQQDGFSIAKYIYENTDMAIIMVTGRGAIDDRVSGYQSGADIYLVKPVDTSELGAAVAALTRRKFKQVENNDAHGWELNRAEMKLRGPLGGYVELTRKEIQLLELFVSASQEILAKETVLRTLGYGDASEKTRALDVAISRLRNKVRGQLNCTLPLQTVQNAGYTFAGQISAA